MKSRKQRRDEIKSDRKAKKFGRIKRAKRDQLESRLRYISDSVAAGAVPVNASLLRPNGSYSLPEFLTLGIYLDKSFTCADCGAEQVWTATQQKWWYEVAKGDLFATARRCRPCRRRERERQAEARRVHLEGVAKKKRRAE
jgi:hypothetical protein